MEDVSNVNLSVPGVLYVRELGERVLKSLQCNG